MFKDARLQERLFDQIHAVEFNMEDDFRTAEVGSILTGGFGSESFERIADDDGETEPIREGSRPTEAHVSTFIDDVDSETLPRVGFQRISDDEEDAVAEEDAEQKQPSKRSRKSASKKRPSKAATKTAAKKKASSKKSAKKRAPSSESDSGEEAGYGDGEARVVES